MTIIPNAPLQQLNTFGLEVYAGELLQADNLNDLQEALERLKHVPEKMVLGGGSNVLFTQNSESESCLVGLKHKENYNSYRVWIGKSTTLF